MPTRTETMWAVVGVHGLYVGTYFTRAAAIADHVRLTERTWQKCRAKGDRAVKVTVTWSEPE